MSPLSKAFKYKKINFAKFLAAITVCLLGYGFNNIYLNKLDFFNRDLLQLFNTPLNSEASDNITLVDVDSNRDGFSSPLIFTDLERLLVAILKYNPKAVLLNFEPLEFTSDLQQKKMLFELLRKNQIFLNMDAKSQMGKVVFWQDPIFDNYPFQYYPSLCRDDDTFSSPRRMLISYYGNTGEKTVLHSLENIGISHKPISYFKYGFERMNTYQLFHKYLTPNSFKTTNTSKILDGSEDANLIKNKIVIIGRVDEFSFMSAENPYNFFGESQASSALSSRLIPAHHVVANQFNAIMTGDYVKYLKGIYFHILVCLILILLIFSPIKAVNKLYVFVLVLPLTILFQISLYAAFSFYLDLVPTYIMLITIQYIGVPIIAYAILKEIKAKQFEELNNARIDALLSVSEKVAHDIRSPLGAINLILSRINFADSEHKEIIKNAINRIDASAENILAKYKIKNDSKLEAFEKIEINKMILNSCSEKKILNSLVNYNLSIAETNNLCVTGYSIELERVLSNILDNSLFALRSSTNPIIKIATSVNETQIILKIFDNGIGIPSSILKIIGNEQVSTKIAEKGHGIGVLHAKRTIERMRGSFDIESEENKYTQVIIRLNLA